MRCPAKTERLMSRTMILSPMPATGPAPGRPKAGETPSGGVLPYSATGGCRYPQDTSCIASIGLGRLNGSRNSNEKSDAVNTGASFSIRAKAFTRLCACLALDALALKRSMNFCRCAMRSFCFSKPACCCSIRSARISSKAV